MLCYAMLCYAMLCYVMLCYVMLCYVMLFYFILFMCFFIIEEGCTFPHFSTNLGFCQTEIPLIVCSMVSSKPNQMTHSHKRADTS